MDVKNKLVKLQIWDIARQELFKNNEKSFFKPVNGILLCYNITDKDSFKNIESWMRQIENNKLNVCKVLVGINCDLEKERVITTQKGEDFATSKGIKFIEISTKDNINIIKSLEMLVEDIINSYEAEKPSDLNKENKTKKDLDKNNCIIF